MHALNALVSVAAYFLLTFKDRYTASHSRSVSTYALLIGKELGLEESTTKRLKTAGLLHDFGKLAIPKGILNKPGPLSPQEREKIDTHPDVGARIASFLIKDRDILEGIAYHHQRLDGSGYPVKLPSNPPTSFSFGEIIAVADVYDAMTSDRPYRPALSPWEALQFLISAELFNQDVVEALFRVIVRLNKQRVEKDGEKLPALNSSLAKASG